MELLINGQAVQADVDPTMPLLWVLRDVLNLTGTKFGCGIAACGACTVHLDGQPIRACALPLREAVGKAITTIEGLPGGQGHPLVKAWIEEQVPQCGYCQSGQIMQAAGLLAKTPKPGRDEIIRHMDGNLCRCGAYSQIVAAVERASREG